MKWNRQDVINWNRSINQLAESTRCGEMCAAFAALTSVVTLWAAYVYALNTPYLLNGDGYTGLYAILTIISSLVLGFSAFPVYAVFVPLALVRFFTIDPPPDKCVKCQNQVSE